MWCVPFSRNSHNHSRSTCRDKQPPDGSRSIWGCVLSPDYLEREGRTAGLRSNCSTCLLISSLSKDRSYRELRECDGGNKVGRDVAIKTFWNVKSFFSARFHRPNVSLLMATPNEGADLLRYSKEDIEIGDEYREDSVDKRDHRLFPEYLLYCEGLPKPALRGVLHLICSLVLPFGMWHLVQESNGSTLGSIAAVVYIFTNMFCYGFSALYHVGKWSIQKEILLQKLDHCGIALLSAGTFFPASILLLPSEIGLLFFLSTFSTFLWTCYHIINLRPSSLRQILVIGTLLPFMPFLSPRMNNIEFWGTILTIIFQAIGLSVFSFRRPNPWPSVFGYHEIFHIFVVLAGICVYFINWSIIRRTCNPYMQISDIGDLIESIFTSHIHP